MPIRVDTVTMQETGWSLSVIRTVAIIEGVVHSYESWTIDADGTWHLRCGAPLNQMTTHYVNGDQPLTCLACVVEARR